MSGFPKELSVSKIICGSSPLNGLSSKKITATLSRWMATIYFSNVISGRDIFIFAISLVNISYAFFIIPGFALVPFINAR